MSKQIERHDGLIRQNKIKVLFQYGQDLKDVKKIRTCLDFHDPVNAKLAV